MTDIDRRSMLGVGLALPAAGLIAAPSQALFAKDGGGVSAPTGFAPAEDKAIAPRERLLFDFGWKFCFGHGSDPSKDLGYGYGQSDFSKTGQLGFAKTGFDDSAWRTLDLPHDWAVELPFVHDDSGQGDGGLRSHGYKPLGRRYPETSIGWYRREFDVPAGDAGRRIWIEFDGAMRDALVFVNGSFVGHSASGYAPFRFEVTDFLAYGARNVIAVRVDASQGEGWFYEGAGIYRHVWLVKTDPVSLGWTESTVRPEIEGAAARLDLATRVENETDLPVRARVKWQITDQTGTVVAVAGPVENEVAASTSAAFSATARLADARLWSPEDPHLYTARVTVETDGVVRDGERIPFGVRSTRFDADKGFFLNGRQTKIKGVCNHQDHAGVGAALPDRLQAWRVAIMQDMGCNAIRTTHNIPTPELVEACDRMGMLLLCETRLLSSSPEALDQLETMVRLYRNSPSVILWSIGNEEWLLQKDMAEQGARMAATMTGLCHRLDPTRKVTVAVNGDNLQGVSDAVDVVGFNYNPWLADAFRQKFPDQPLIYTEIASATTTRGEYATDPARNVMSSYDGVVSWGQRPEDWWKWQMEREWMAGGFAWTGFDYRGEPTPYEWPSINSQFGIVDMCGFPKDDFFYYQAWWGKAPVLHLFPHWNWAGREGKEIPVRVYSNLDEVELLVNGKSLGRKSVPRLGHLEWQVIYAPGAIEARGFRGGRQIMAERRETTGDSAEIRLSADRLAMAADGEDIVMIRADVLDRRGRLVPTAHDKVKFRVSGAGSLIGLGNGDPNCHENDKGTERSLFNGLAQAIVQAGKRAGPIMVEAGPANSGSLKPARLVLRANKARHRPSVA